MTGPAHRWAGRWWRRRGLESYRRSDLARDVGAGVMVTALLIPAGMGYATVAALPPETGLYATVAALVAYALVGPSRVLVLGPDSSLAPLIAAAIVPLAAAGAAGEERRVALAGVLALLVGVILVTAGALRLGFVSELLSKPIRLGYLSGVALVVVVGQIPALLGFSVDAEGLLSRAAAAARGIRDGEVVPAAAAIGVGSLALVVLLRRVAPRAPGLLIAVAAATGLVWALGLDSVPVVGPLPSGVPAPAWGSLAGSDVVALAGPALGIAVVAFADTAVLSRALATSPGGVDGSREMAALGAANVACGVAGGFPVSASASRTPVAQASGARTQVTGLVGAAAVALVVVLAPGLSRHLPTSVLAAVVIAAVLTIVDVPLTVRLARVDRREFGLAVLAFAGVAVLGVLWGVVAAVSLSLAAFVAKAWRPHVAELVRVDGRKGYHDRARHPGGRRVPGLLMLRFDAPLFFANAELFAEFVHRSVAESPEPVRWVVVASEPITDIDTTAADVLEQLYDSLDAQGIRLVLAELKGPVKDRLARFGLGPRLRAGGVYPTLGTAVSAYVEASGVDWVDWTDRPDGDLTTATGGAGPPRPPDRRW
ncbi:MAG TPA: SulP family inorganic anion transporter [Acidimicrobiales bacterium]|nr:SulP family inorganic anion transporter [Acidimicrobiales bacterium]